MSKTPIESIRLEGFGNYSNHGHREKVARITKTQIILENGSRYNRRTGARSPRAFEWSGYRVSTESLAEIQKVLS